MEGDQRTFYTNQNGSDTEPPTSVNLLIISIYTTLFRGQAGGHKSRQKKVV